VGGGERFKVMLGESEGGRGPQEEKGGRRGTDFRTLHLK